MGGGIAQLIAERDHDTAEDINTKAVGAGLRRPDIFSPEGKG
jgi:hypothetical protein